MTFNLFGIDAYFSDGLYGFWIGAVKTTNNHRALFSVYYDKEWQLYLLWLSPIYFRRLI